LIHWMSNRWQTMSKLSTKLHILVHRQASVINQPGPAESPTSSLAPSIFTTSHHALGFVMQLTLTIKVKHSRWTERGLTPVYGRKETRRVEELKEVCQSGDAPHSSPDNADLWTDPTLEDMSIDSGTDNPFVGLSHQGNTREKCTAAPSRAVLLFKHSSRQKSLESL